MLSADLLSAYGKNPPNKRPMPDATVRYREENRLCDDAIVVSLKIENGILVDFAFEGETALVTTACASVFGESVVGMPAEELLALDERYVRDTLGIEVTHRRRQSSVFALLAVRNALHIWKNDGLRDDFASVLVGR